MSKDYYNILGVEKSADKGAIKKAFHKLAHKYHPDKNDGDDTKFKEINQAYQTLSDDKKRAQYDRFGSTGPAGGGQGYGGFDFSGFQQAGGNAQFDFGGIDLDDIFSAFTGGGFQRARRGRDVETAIQIAFKDAVFGVHKKITIPDIADQSKTKQLDITIPAGIADGQKLRMTGQGEQITDGQPGDLYIRIQVQPHEVFRREGKHLIVDMQVKLTDAILGAKYPLTLLDDSEIKVKIPRGLGSGEVLRLRGRGIQTGMFGKGDILIRTSIDVPKKLTSEQKKLIEKLQKEGL